METGRKQQGKHALPGAKPTCYSLVSSIRQKQEAVILAYIVVYLLMKYPVFSVMELMESSAPCKIAIPLRSQSEEILYHVMLAAWDTRTNTNKYSTVWVTDATRQNFSV